MTTILVKGSPGQTSPNGALALTTLGVEELGQQSPLKLRQWLQG